MRAKEYTGECWAEFWNSDSKAWRVIDRLSFFLLPFISFILFVLPKFGANRGWDNMLVNLSWIIPLAILLLYLLIIVPYRLVGKYHRKHQTTIDRLVTVWSDGNKLKTEIYANYKQLVTDNVKERYNKWVYSVVDVFLDNPNELGKAKLISLDVENKDAIDVPLPQVMERNNEITGYYIYLATRVSKLNRIIQDLSKDKG